MIRPVHPEKAQRNILYIRTFLLFGHFHAGHVFAHFHDHVVQAAGVDVYLFHQVADFAYQAERIAIQALYGIGNGLGRLCVSGQEPDHQPLLRVVV